MNEWKNQPGAEWMNEWIHYLNNEWTLINLTLNVWMNKWKILQMNEWMNEYWHEVMNEYITSERLYEWITEYTNKLKIVWMNLMNVEMNYWKIEWINESS